MDHSTNLGRKFNQFSLKTKANSTSDIFPCSGFISLIGILRAGCIVVSCILNVAILVGARTRIGIKPHVEYLGEIFICI